LRLIARKRSRVRVNIQCPNKIISQIVSGLVYEVNLANCIQIGAVAGGVGANLPAEFAQIDGGIILDAFHIFNEGFTKRVRVSTKVSCWAPAMPKGEKS